MNKLSTTTRYIQVHDEHVEQAWAHANHGVAARLTGSPSRVFGPRPPLPLPNPYVQLAQLAQIRPPVPNIQHHGLGDAQPARRHSDEAR